MEIVYALERPEGVSQSSIFLAGPSPRGNGEYDWRPEALAYIASLGFLGTVYVPLPRDGQYLADYDHDAQVDWEYLHLEECSAIAFWVPRDLVTLPGFTTNVEFGLFARSGKLVLGYPHEAPKMKYLQRVAEWFTIPTRHTLEDTLLEATQITLVGKNSRASMRLLDDFEF